MTHEGFGELAAGAVLGDLDPIEHAAWTGHRVGCPTCARLQDDLEAVAAEVALLTPRRRPPPALHDAVVEAIRADRETRGAADWPPGAGGPPGLAGPASA